MVPAGDEAFHGPVHQIDIEHSFHAPTAEGRGHGSQPDRLAVQIPGNGQLVEGLFHQGSGRARHVSATGGALAAPHRVAPAANEALRLYFPLQGSR